MKLTIRADVSPASTIRVREDGAWAQVIIDDLTLNFHGLSWPSDRELAERIGTIDRLIVALQTIRSTQLRQAVLHDEISETEQRMLAGDR